MDEDNVKEREWDKEEEDERKEREAEVRGMWEEWRQGRRGESNKWGEESKEREV